MALDLLTVLIDRHNYINFMFYNCYSVLLWSDRLIY